MTDISRAFRRARLLFVPVDCIYTPKRECDRMRRMFNKTVKADFRAAARMTVPLSVTMKDILKLETHHIVPLKLGGSNEKSNLALINPALHALVHEYIDEQIRRIDPRTGQQVRVNIPMKFGYYWG